MKVLTVHSKHFGEQTFHTDWELQITPRGDLRVTDAGNTALYCHGFWEGYDITEVEDDE